MLHFCIVACESAAAYTTPASPKMRAITIALMDFISMSPVSLKSCRQTSRYTTGVMVADSALMFLNQENTAAPVGSAAIKRLWSFK
jgi:hypothetical protein